MNFNDLLQSKNINPEHVIVLRHRPQETELNKVLPWLAVTKPEVFNAYQQSQGAKVEKVMRLMEKTGYVASFIGREAGKAIFVGLFAIEGSELITNDVYWGIAANIELKKFSGNEIKEERPSILWFNLELTDFYSSWKGRLVVNWPPPELSWWRRAHRNELSIHAIHEDSVFEEKMPMWEELVVSWDQLGILPRSWESALKQWRGIYYVFDSYVGKGYVGSAYGDDNILGRWKNYAVSGHGGNKLLLNRDPRNFYFSILQRVSPDMSQEEIGQIEKLWKKRLHTGHPFGLNEN